MRRTRASRSGREVDGDRRLDSLGLHSAVADAITAFGAPSRCRKLLKERVITVTGMMLPSYAHNSETLEQTIAAFAKALEIVAYADRHDDLHRHIELPLL